MDKVRAKFYVETVSHNCWNKDGAQVRLFPVISGSEENDSFAKSTPAGTIDLIITNPDALPFFELGKEVYVDFTAATANTD